MAQRLWAAAGALAVMSASLIAGGCGSDETDEPDETGGGGSGATGGTGGTAGSGGSGAGQCGDQPCGTNQVCVLPCCGGALPPCYPKPPQGECEPGDTEVSSSECSVGCDADPCCEPGPCQPPPPYCVNESDLVCGGQPEVGDQCSVDGCYGQLEADGLHCMCA